jgi:glutamate decarboxylase
MSRPADQNDVKSRIESLFTDNCSAVLRTRLLDSLRRFTERSEVRDSITETELASYFRTAGIPYYPQDMSAYADFLEETVLPHSVNLASPYCLGHMTGTLPFSMQVLAEALVGLNQNLVKQDASVVLTMMERQTLAMLHRLVFSENEEFYSRHTQARDETLGVMASCGTLANLTALWCARNNCFPTGNGAPGVEEDGLAAVLRYYDYEKAVVLGSSLVHYSIEKAAGVLGFGSRGVIKLPVDSHNRLCVYALEEAVELCKRRRWRVVAIMAVAGTTECGTIDSIGPIADVASKNGIHLHVDAAWGGPLLFSARHRARLDGIERADSVTIDAHKQLCVPIGVSAVILRCPFAARAIEMRANYILRNGSGDLGKTSIEGSRPGTSLFLHAALHLFGLAGYEYLIDENIEKARLMACLIRQFPEFELLTNPETNIVIYRYIPERFRFHLTNGGFDQQHNEQINLFNIGLQQAQYEAGKTFVSRTILNTLPGYENNSIVCLRAVIANPLVREHHLTGVLQDQTRIAMQLEQAMLASSV